MNYMMGRLDDEDFEFLYGWLWDRTRAVRKDLRTQSIDRPEDLRAYLECFEQCARFLLLCLHHMSLSDNEDYSHQQDVEQLNQTFITLRQRYADNRRAKILSDNEAEFQAYRLIIALSTGDEKVEYEIQTLPESIRRNRRVQTAMQIYRAGKMATSKSRMFSEAQQNWRAFWSLIQSSAVSYLMACAAELFFNQVRGTVLDALRRAYRQGSVKHANQENVHGEWPVTELVEMLGFDSEDDVREYCEAYGYTITTIQSGEEYVNFAVGKGPEDPNGPKPQTFSERLVESKRHCRLFSGVIRGMSVKEARIHGLVEEPESDMEAEGSLFIPEGPTATPIKTGGVPSLSSTTQSLFNPSASIFQPATSTSQTNVAATTTPAKPSIFAPPTTTTGFAATTNPFQSQAASQADTTTGKPSIFTSPFSTNNPATAQTVQPGLFNPSEHAIKFAPKDGPSAVGQRGLFNPSEHAIKFSPSASSSDSTSSFTSIATASSAPSSSTTVTTASLKDATSGKPTSSPFASVFSAKGSPPQATTSPFFKGFSATKTAPPPSTTPESIFKPSPQPSKYSLEGSSPFPFPRGSQTTSPKPSILSSSISSTGPAKKVTFALAEETPSGIEEQRREKEEEERRLQEEKLRQAREERERAKQAQERREREEQERRAREEQERRIREEQQRRALEEQQRAAEAQRRQQAQQLDSAFNALTNNVLFDPVEGLLTQFIEQQVKKMFPKAEEDVWWEWAEQRSEEMYQRKRLQLARFYAVRWFQQVQKKKRARRSRERRRWLKEHKTELLALQKEETKGENLENVQLNGFKKPTVPASISGGPREKRRDSTRTKVPSNGITDRRARTKPKEKPLQPPVQEEKSRPLPQPVQKVVPVQPYKNHAMPADRTETTWFQLRARGLDPSKILKRGFDESESSEEEQVHEQGRKRARTSASSSQNDMDALARYELLKQTLKLNNSARESPQSPHHARSRSSSYTSAAPTDHSLSHTLDVVARARALLERPPSTQASPSPHVQHDFSRSVPDLTSGMRASYGEFPARSSYMQPPVLTNKPAYWYRQSRFVPRHLYGKGPEAVREYYRQSRGVGTGSPSASGAETQTQPQAQAQVQDSADIEPSSPIPTQMSYVHLDTQSQVQMYMQGPMEQEQVPQQDGEDDMGEASSYYSEDANVIFSKQRQYHGEEMDETEDEFEENEDEDEDEEMSDEDGRQYEEDEYGDDYPEDANVYGREDDDEEEEEGDYSEEEQESEQQAQRPPSYMGGTTQDDAIELSD